MIGFERRFFSAASGAAAPYVSVLFAALLFLTAAPALAVSIGFTKITDKSAADAAVGEALYADAGSGHVARAFRSSSSQRWHSTPGRRHRPARTAANRGETIGLLVDLKGFTGFSEVGWDRDRGEPRIKLHDQRFGDDQSETVVNSPVPEPGTMLGLGTFVLVGVALRRWRRASLATA